MRWDAENGSEKKTANHFFFAFQCRFAYKEVLMMVFNVFVSVFVVCVLINLLIHEGKKLL